MSSMTFEDLDAWKKARRLVNAIYSLTREPALARDFGLCGQIQRATATRRRFASKITGSAALIILVGWWGLRLLS